MAYSAIERFTLVDVDSVLIGRYSLILTVTGQTAPITAGMTVTGQTSGATGIIVEYVNNDYAIIRNIFGTFTNETVSYTGGTFTIFDAEFIEYEAGELEIYEPWGFSEFINNLERGSIEGGDKTASLGFVAEFGEAESELGFDWNKVTGEDYSPRSMLSSIFTSTGIDANILFRYYRTSGGTETLDYEWALLFNSVNEEDDRIYIRVKREDFGDKLRTRFDIDIDIESTVDLDDNANSALTLIDLPLHSRKLQLIYNGDYVIADVSTSIDFDNDVFVRTGQSGSGTFIDLSAIVATRDEIGLSGILSLDYDTEIGELFIAPYDGIYSFDIYQQAQDDLVGSPSPGFSVATLQVKLSVNDTVYTASKSTSTASGATNAEFTLDQDIYIRKNDIVKLYWEDSGSNEFYHVRLSIDGSQNVSTISYVNIDAKTEYYPSAVKGAFLQEALQKAIAKATGTNPFLQSKYIGKTVTVDITTSSETGTISVGQLVTGGTSGARGTITDYVSDDYITMNSVIGFFTKDETVSTATGTAQITTTNADFNYDVNDGYGSVNFITTGKKIRGLTTNSNLKVKIKDLVDFNRMRYGMGWQIVEQSDGSKRFVLEKNYEFFNENNILTLYNVETPVKRSLNEQLVFNQFESGYSSFAKNNEDGSIAGFNTKVSRLMPIEKDNRKIGMVTDLIADSAEIERVRRLEIKADESDQSDDKLFIIKCQRFNSTNRIKCHALLTSDSSTDVLGYAVIISGGDTITLDGWYLKGQADNASTITLTTTSITQAISIDSISYNKQDNKTVITTGDTITAGNNTYTNAQFHFDIDIYLPERVEPFTWSTIDGVYDANSEYNIDHAPSQFLIQWWNILGSGFSQKATSKKVKFLSGVNDVSLSKAYASNTYSYTTDDLGESSDITLANINSYNAIKLKPFKWELVCYLSYSDWKTLRSALLGENWGYVRFTDNFGNFVDIYPVTLKRTEESGKVEIMGWEKKKETIQYLGTNENISFLGSDGDDIDWLGQ